MKRLILGIRRKKNPPKLGNYRPYNFARVNECFPSHQEAAVSQDRTHNL